MASILLVVIYVAFISLGLPDSVLGSAWPSMYEELNVSVSAAGTISMIIAGGTIISSLLSGKIIRKFGTGRVTMVSVAMTAVALLGFSFSDAYWQLCLWGIPYGLGAGSVDAALNNFVAIHYKPRHMSWLHCFWGIGATAGPYIMGLCLTNGMKWAAGYRLIGAVQVILVLFLIISLPLWKKQKDESQEEEEREVVSFAETLRLPGAKAILIAFFCYCSVEATAGFWASSYLVLYKGIDPETTASWAALFYLGITIGRLACGFITGRQGDKKMVRLGQLITVIGIIFLLLPIHQTATLVGLVLLGGGCAPIYPSMLHATPNNFGKEKSQSIMGMQMACAYVGSTFVPPIFGVLSEVTHISIYPVFLLAFVALMVFMVERMNKVHT